MVLPKFLIRGEILILQVIVYNYLNVDLNNVLVTLSKTNDFKRVLLKNRGTSNELIQINNDLETMIPSIKSQTAQTVTFLIAPIKIGSLPLTVKARSTLAADAERKNVLVKAEGVEDFNSIPFLIDLREIKKYTTRYQINLPTNVVPDSQYCSFQVIGDMLGPAFNNLENLVTKPYGCGEQNMITLTPNIYALKYLLATSSRKNSKINNLAILIQNSKNNIQFGYQNQLNYLRNDGSFSAFGNQDKSGSTWLTAFVIRSFSEAREFATIDANVIKNSVNWLIGQQSQDGSFMEPGNVIHR
jgi:CD109 antigen